MKEVTVYEYSNTETMSGNCRNSEQQQQYYQQEGYCPGGQEHMGTVYYQQQPQYVNPPHRFQPHQIPPQHMYYQQQTTAQPYFDQGYQGQVYYGNNQGMMQHGGYSADHSANFNQYQGPPRGRGRGQRRMMGGRGGRGYQSQGRHKRYNENQNSNQTSRNKTSGADSSTGDDNNECSSAIQGAEGSDNTSENKPSFHFNEAKDHYDGDKEEKTFADSAAPEKSSARRGYNNRGGRSYSRGTHRQRGSYNESQISDGQTETYARAPPSGDRKLAQREAREKLLAIQKRRQLPEGDDEEEAEPPPELEETNNSSTAQRLVTSTAYGLGPFTI